MSIQSPVGTLDIKNATLRVGKLEVSNIQGVDTALNVTRANSVLIYDDQVSTTTFNGFTSSVGVRDTGNGYLDLAGGYVYWGQKLPNSWVMDFEMDIRSGTNAGPLYANVFSTTNTGGDGYSFTFNDSNDKISLYYDSTLLTETTVSGLFTASEDWQKVVINYERGLIAISLDGSRKLYYKDIERETPYVNGEYVSFSSASTDGRKIRDLRIVNGEKWVYSGESNVVYTQGSVGIGVTDPTVALDVSGTVKATVFDGDGSAITNISSANVGDFASNVVRIENLETSNGHIWSSLASNVTILRGEIDSNLATARTDLQSNVTILRDEIDSNLATARTDLQSNVTILRDEIDSNLATARTDLQSNVTILRDEIDSNLATARTDLQSNVTILRDEIDSNLATARTDLQSNVTILRDEIDSNLATARTDLQSNVTILRGEIDSNLATARTDLQSNVTILRGEIDSNLATARTDLQSNVTILRGEIHSNLPTARTNLQSNVTILRGEIDSNLATARTDLQSNVTILRGEIDSNLATARTDLQSNVTILRGEIDSNLATARTDLQSNVTILRDTAITFMGTKTFQDDVVLESNLRVQGDLLVANTVNMTVSDPILELGSNNQNTGDVGLVMTRHGASNSNVAIFFDETADTLKLGYTLNGAGDSTLEFDSNALAVSVQGALAATSVSGNGSGLTSLNATNISSGTINKDRLPGTLNDTTFGSITLTSSTCLYVDGDYLAYKPVESGSPIARNFVKFIKTNNASYPFYTNRTPSGDVVIGSGTTAAGGEIERMRFKGGDGTRDIEVSNANLVVSGNITGGTIDATKISNGTLADSTGGVKAIYFTNTEQSGYYTDKAGILAFDENFYDDTEYGTGTYDPDATFVGGNGGGLLIKNEDGWGAIFTSQNTRWAKGYWDTLNVTNTVTASTFSGSGSGLTSLNAGNLASGTVPSARLSLAASDIPSLDASKITTGTLGRPIDTTTGTFSGRVDSERYLTSNTFPLPDPNQHSFRHVCMRTNSSVPYGLTQAGGCIYEYNPSTGDTVRVVEPVSEPTAGTFTTTAGREYFPMGSPMAIVGEHKMAPFTNLGSLFGFIESRYDASTAYLYAPYTNVTVEYFHDTSVTGTPTSTIVVPSKTVTTFTCTTAGGTNSHIFVAKGGKILMSSTGNGGDTRVLAPLSTIAYGYNNTNFANDIYLENDVTTSGKCVYSNQNVPLILSQAGDGDGGAGTCGIPFELVADTYIVPHDIRGWMIQFLYTETVVNVAYWSATNSQWEQYGTYSPSGTPSILSPEQLQVGKMSLTGTDIGTSHTLWMFTGTKDFTLTVEEYTDLERTVSGFRAHQVAQQIQTNLLDNVIQDSSGNVGIGTTNPTEALLIYRNDANPTYAKIRSEASNRAGIILSEDNQNNIIIEYDGTGSGDGNYLSFYSGVSTWAGKGTGLNYVPSNGRVGIGTASPRALLDVSGPVDVPAILTSGASSSEGDIAVLSGEAMQIGHWDN